MNVKWEVIVAVAALFILAIVAMIVQPWQTPDREIGQAEQRIVATMAASASEAVEGAGDVVSEAKLTVIELKDQRNALVQQRDELQITIEAQEETINSQESRIANLEGQLLAAQQALEALGASPEVIGTPIVTSGTEVASATVEPEGTPEPTTSAEDDNTGEVWVLDNQVPEAIADVFREDPRFADWVVRTAESCSDLMDLPGTPTGIVLDYEIPGGFNGDTCFVGFNVQHPGVTALAVASVETLNGNHIPTAFANVGVENFLLLDKQQGEFQPIADELARLLGLEAE